MGDYKVSIKINITGKDDKEHKLNLDVNYRPELATELSDMFAEIAKDAGHVVKLDTRKLESDLIEVIRKHKADEMTDIEFKHLKNMTDDIGYTICKMKNLDNQD